MPNIIFRRPGIAIATTSTNDDIVNNHIYSNIYQRGHLQQSQHHISSSRDRSIYTTRHIDFPQSLSPYRPEPTRIALAPRISGIILHPRTTYRLESTTLWDPDVLQWAFPMPTPYFVVRGSLSPQHQPTRPSSTTQHHTSSCRGQSGLNISKILLSTSRIVDALYFELRGCCGPGWYGWEILTYSVGFRNANALSGDRYRPKIVSNPNGLGSTSV